MRLSIAENYRPEAFQGLPEFRQAKLNLEEFRTLLPELGSVICGHGLNGSLGVNLLHQHFELEASEQLAKYKAPRKNVSYIMPYQIEESRTAYFWKPSRQDEGFIYEPLEFFRRGQVPEDLPDIYGIFEENPDFFGEFAEKLFELGLSDVFGLAILHSNYLDVPENHILVEKTNAQDRYLSIEVEHEEEVDLDDLTQTVWSFTLDTCELIPDNVFSPKPPEPPDPQCTGESHCTFHCKDHCDFHCDTHCTGHCKGHCKGHCGAHCRAHCMSHCEEH